MPAAGSAAAAAIIRRQMNRSERRRAERLAAKTAGSTAKAGGAAGVAQQASALLEGGKAAEAEAFLRALLSAEPGNVEALVWLSRALRFQDKIDEAVAYARRAAIRGRMSAQAQTALGEALRMQDRVFEAIECHQRAVELAPEDGDAHHAFGMSLIDAGDLPAAIAHLQQAVAAAPRSMRYVNSLAIALTTLGDFEQAGSLFDRVLQSDPQNPQVRFNRSFCLLGTGRLAEGWADYEYGIGAGARLPNRTFDVPRWDGTPLGAGQRLLVWREQGIGDEIRLASCYPDVLADVADVIIETEPRLLALLRRSFPSAAVRTETWKPEEAQHANDFAAHIPAASLPLLYRSRLEDFSQQGGYLVSDPHRRAEFRRRLDALGPQPKVGICWRSMRLDVKRLVGYTTLEEWEPVLAVPDVTFVNLQYGQSEHLEGELRAAEERNGVRVHRWDDVDYTADINAVAAMIDELDLVVSVTTAVSAMAGALGKPLFQIGLTNDPFQFGTDRYPWFPTLQVFAREVTQGWGPTMERVAAAVADSSSYTG